MVAALGCALRFGVGGSVLLVVLFVVCGHILGLCWHILGAMLLQLEVMSGWVVVGQ